MSSPIGTFFTSIFGSSSPSVDPEMGAAPIEPAVLRMASPRSSPPASEFESPLSTLAPTQLLSISAAEDEIALLRSQVSFLQGVREDNADEIAQLQQLISVPEIPRNRSLQASDLAGASSQMMSQTLLHTQREAEKKSPGFLLLTSVESTSIMAFCSKFAHADDSLVQAHEHIASTLRQQVFDELVSSNLLGVLDTLKDLSKGELLFALRALVTFREDITPEAVLQSLAMKRVEKINRTETGKFLADAQHLLTHFPVFFSVLMPKTTKTILFELLGSSELRRDLQNPRQFAQWTENEMSVLDFVKMIMARMNAVLRFNRECEEHGHVLARVAASPAQVLIPPVSNASPSSVPIYIKRLSPAALAQMTCHRCALLGHSFHTCTTKCTLCGKSDCKCYRHKVRSPTSSVRRRRNKLLCPRTFLCSRLRKPAAVSPAAFAIADTGANALFVPNIIDFSSPIVSLEDKVIMANSDSAPTTGQGSVGDYVGLHAPGFTQALVPGTVLTDQSIVVLRDSNMHLLSLSQDTVHCIDSIINTDATHRLPFAIPRSNGLYGLSKDEFVRLTNLRSELPLTANSSYFTTDLGRLGDLVRYFHESWNHASKVDMLAIVDNNIFSNIPKSLTREVILKYFDDYCFGCKMATLREKSKPQQSFTVYHTGEYCAMDIHVWERPCFSGHTMSLHARDLGSEMSWVFLLKHASDIDDHVRRMVTIYRASGFHPKVFRMDKQFVTDATRNLCLTNTLVLEELETPSEISIQMPGPYEHAQAGDIESHIKVAVESVKKTLCSADLEYGFWGFAVTHSVAIYITMPSRKDPTRSRFALWTGLSYVPQDLLVVPALPFGSRVIAHIPLKMQQAHSLRGVRTIYVGSAPGVKGGILLFDPATKRTKVRVTFKNMGQRDSSPSTSQQDIPLVVDDDDSYQFDDDTFGISRFELVEPVPLSPPPVILPPASAPVTHSYVEQKRSDMLKRSQHRYFNKIGMCFFDADTHQHMKITGVYMCTSGSGIGSKTPLYRFYDTDLYPGGPISSSDYEHQSCSELLRSREIRWDDLVNVAFIEANAAALQYFDDQVGIDRDVCTYVTALRAEFTEMLPPKTVSKMRVHPEDGHLASWMREVGALHAQKMTIPADLPIGDIPPELILQLMPIFQKKWVGTDFAKFKCRLVGLGQHWKNVNSLTTSAGMVSMDTIKFLLSIAAVTDAEIVLLDVDEAFLTTRVNKVRKQRSKRDPPPPDNTYYLRRPPGATDAEMPYIMKPRGFIYGHPLANREFDLDCNEKLIDIGFMPTNYDSKVYTRPRADGSMTVLARAVDDNVVFLTGTSAQKAEVLAALQGLYTMKITDPATVVLGLELASRDFDRHTLMLRQRGSIDSLLSEHIPDWLVRDIDTFAMIPAPPPRDLSARDLGLSNVPCSIAEKALYQRIFGQLQWITHTAPDFIPAVHDRSYHLQQPSHLDLARLHQIVSCLARIRRLDKDGLTLGGSEGVKVLATVDTSYGSPSVTGITTHMATNTGSITSISKRQPFATDSAMASEGVGGHFGAKRVMGLRYFLGELGHAQCDPSDIYMDNQPFLDTITKGRGCSERSKPILIRYNVVKEAWEQDEIDLKHLKSENMVADLLSKNLARERWYQLRDVLLGNSPIVLDESLTALVETGHKLVVANFCQFREYAMQW